MKELTYIIGLLSSVALSIGFLFRLLQWPGGGYLSVWGSLGLGFLFLPLLANQFFRGKRSSIFLERLKMMAGLVAGLVLTLSVLFKTSQWPGADLLLIVGVALFALVFLPVLFFSLYRNADNSAV